MKSHIQIVSVLHIAMGIFGLAVAAAIFLFVALAGGLVASQGAAGAGGILGLFAFAIGGFCAALSLPGIIGGWALWTGRPWGHVVVLILAALHVFNFPLGTALGAYTFWALLFDPERPTLPAPAPAPQPGV